MTREEAIKVLSDRGLWGIDSTGTIKAACQIALTALRPVSREQVERMRGEWIDAYPGTSSCKCTKCGAVQEYESTFCCHCGAPMTDEAVEMVIERWEALKDA